MSAFSEMFADGFEIIDLSVTLEDRAVSEPVKPRIRYYDHRKGYWQMRFLFGVRKAQLRVSDGLGWAIEKVTAITHTGTHLDAPYHYGPQSGGKPARRIDEVPLEWCFAPGVRLDFRHLENGDEITVAELEEALRKIDYQLSENDIVLLQTGADQRIDSKDYFQQPGLGREGTLWLVERGVKVIGIDAYTIDRPFAVMKEEFKSTKNPEVLWPAHFAGIEQEYCQIEKLARLDQIPMDYGFFVSCLPVKIKGASAGWCRAVALIPRNENCFDQT